MAANRKSVHFSSNNHELETPPEFFKNLDDEFHFTLDPCSSHANAKCSKHYTKAEDGLKQDWSGERVFMNPPYGRAVKHWIRKALDESYRGALVVCLVAARTDTAWFQDYAMQGEIRFLRGRLRFVGTSASAPFPSAIVIFKPKTK